MSEQVFAGKSYKDFQTKKDVHYNLIIYLLFFLAIVLSLNLSSPIGESGWWTYQLLILLCAYVAAFLGPFLYWMAVIAAQRMRQRV